MGESPSLCPSPLGEGNKIKKARREISSGFFSDRSLLIISFRALQSFCLPFSSVHEVETFAGKQGKDVYLIKLIFPFLVICSPLVSVASI